jgi:hypothetical protein
VLVEHDEDSSLPALRHEYVENFEGSFVLGAGGEGEGGRERREEGLEILPLCQREQRRKGLKEGEGTAKVRRIVL